MFRPLLLSTALAAATATASFADETRGEVLAYDRVDHVLVLTDNTVWHLPDTLEVPQDLRRGDQVHIDFQAAGENGIAAVFSIEKVEGASKG